MMACQLTTVMTHEDRRNLCTAFLSLSGVYDKVLECMSLLKYLTLQRSDSGDPGKGGLH